VGHRHRAIRGFAIVLTLGIATSMFTSLLGSRALITLMYGGRRKVARLSIGCAHADAAASRRHSPRITVEFFHRATSFPFMSTRKVWYGLSIALILISVVAGDTRPESRRGLHRRRDRAGELSRRPPIATR
jgi:predicted RND superfamily exporter protein